MPTFNLTTNGNSHMRPISARLQGPCGRAACDQARSAPRPSLAVPGDRVSSSQLVQDLSKAVAKATGKPEAVSAGASLPVVTAVPAAPRPGHVVASGTAEGRPGGAGLGGNVVYRWSGLRATQHASR